MGKKWSGHEIYFLRNNFYGAGRNQIIKMLHNRTCGAIKAKAMKLGLRRFNPLWKLDEDTVIKQHYPNGKNDIILGLLPNRKCTTIKARANFLKI